MFFQILLADQDHPNQYAKFLALVSFDSQVYFVVSDVEEYLKLSGLFMDIPGTRVEHVIGPCQVKEEYAAKKICLQSELVDYLESLRNRRSDQLARLFSTSTKMRIIQRYTDDNSRYPRFSTTDLNLAPQLEVTESEEWPSRSFRTWLLQFKNRIMRDLYKKQELILFHSYDYPGAYLEADHFPPTKFIFRNEGKEILFVRDPSCK